MKTRHLVVCVGLGAVAALAACKESPPADAPPAKKTSGAASSGKLSPAERATLLKLARRSLVASVSGLEMRSMTDGLRITERLKQRQGAFVTLKKHGRLRGCIGYILPRAPLYQAVLANARNAALNDRRFQPVAVAELQQIEIEISALSVPRPVASFRDIVVGKHGIILAQGHMSATFLPHVASEQRWDRATTLRHLSRKAGLDTDAWKDPKTKYQVYTAEVWSEGGGAH